MSEQRLKIGGFKFARMRSVWPKISGTKAHPPPTILSVRKLDERIYYMV